MREIITLQFGQQANYLGTHYWNAQESYFTYSGEDDSPVDHDKSFRAGIGADGQDTYTPRTLLYDIKGAFGTLRRENALYALQQNEDPAGQSGWGGATIPLRLPAIAPSPYQQALDAGSAPPQLTPETVRFWSDFNHLFYHPRSIVQLNEYELNSSLLPFERFNTGEELFANLDREHDLLDRDLRPFLEECDHVQGLQILTGIDDAWGGFAAKYLERVSDELGKGSRWVFGLQDGKRTARDRMMLQVANSAQSIYAINQAASLHIPMTSIPASLPDYLALNGDSRWHTSALQASAMESITLPTRLRSTESARATFNDLEIPLSNDGNRRVASTTMSIDDPEQLEEKKQETGDKRMANGYTNGDHASEPSKLDISFLPVFTVGSQTSKSHTFGTITSLRGAWRAPPSSTGPSTGYNASRFDDYNHTYPSSLLFPSLASYPEIFQFKDKPAKFAIETSLSTSTGVAERIRGLEGASRRLIGIDEREALCDGLATMAEEYEDGWSEGSESDDED